jgi:hypothetical protein
VVASHTGTLTAYDEHNGAVRWQVPFDPDAAPLIVGDTVTKAVTVCSDSMPLAGYHLGTGQEKWMLPFGARVTVNLACIRAERLPRSTGGHCVPCSMIG